MSDLTRPTLTVLRRTLPVQCPACRDHLGTGPVVKTCPTCETPHHEACLAELGCSSLQCRVGGTLGPDSATAHDTFHSLDPRARERFDRVFDYLWNDGDPLVEGLDCGEVAGSGGRFVVLGNWNDVEEWTFRPGVGPVLPGHASSAPQSYYDPETRQSHPGVGPVRPFLAPNLPRGYREVTGHDTTPSRACRLFERLGVDVEWSDMFVRCECGKFFCTEPSWGEPDYWLGDGDYLCCECVEAEAVPCCERPERAQCDGTPNNPCSYQEPWECHCECNAHECEECETRHDTAEEASECCQEE